MITITTIAFILIAAAAVIQIIYLIKGKTESDPVLKEEVESDPVSKKEVEFDPVSHFFLIGAAVLLLIDFIEKSIRIQFAAITNTFESLSFYSMMVTIVLIIFRFMSKKKKYPYILFGGTIITIILLALPSSPLAPKEVLPPIPALQSAWLALHVSFSFIGEAFFVFGFIAAVYYLVTNDAEKKNNIYRLMYTFIAIGYPIFTAGALIFGAIWAQASWGSYWSWDPKETWALITWLVYTAYLHTRLVPKIDKKYAAILSIIGFALTLFTFIGVNYLLTGNHSYG